MTDLNYLKSDKDIIETNIAYWESMEDTFESDTQYYYESMMDRVQTQSTNASTPGFTIGTFMFVLLTIGLLVNKKSK